jgi:hypothetical protein
VEVIVEEFTASEKRLLGLKESDPIPTGGVSYQIYSYTGFGQDAKKSWSAGGNSLKSTLRKAFGTEFYPGSLNVHLVTGDPWIRPPNITGRKIQLGVFRTSFVLPVILNEKCVAIAAAINIRGFDPATLERVLPTMDLGEEKLEISQIYSTVNIRKRLDLEDLEKTDDIPITARLLPNDSLIDPRRVNG